MRHSAIATVGRSVFELANEAYSVLFVGFCCTAKLLTTGVFEPSFWIAPADLEELMVNILSDPRASSA